MSDNELTTQMLEPIGPVGPFEILHRLGAGGMGEVYLARDSRLRRNVALKLLERSLIGHDKSRLRFLREARLASSLDHPNICTIHEVGEASGLLFIAMQYIEGKTLRQIIGGRPLDLRELFSIGLQVGSALEAAHARGIIHRDIKTANIMITPGGQAKVLDFGLATPMQKEEDETELTHAGVVMGTPTYMSPEQAQGKELDHRSDIFSFGIVLYEMATGQTPFKGRSTPETMSAIIHEPHPSIEQLNKNVPPGLSAIIDRALAKEPSDRYQSIGEMLKDLKEAAKVAGFTAVDSSDHLASSHFALRSSTFEGASKRIPGVYPLVAIAFAVLLIALAALWYFRKPDSVSTIRSVAVLPFKPLIAGDRDEPLEMGMADTLIARLSNLSEINVRPISSVRKYAGLEQDAIAAGREQKVDAVLDGQIQKAGDEVRVTVRLVNVRDGSPIWTSQFDEKMTGLFRVQDSISARVAEILAVKLTGAQRDRLTKHLTDDAEAYELYLKGRYHLNRLTDDGSLKAVDYFQQVTVRDPGFALAYVGLSDAYSNLAGFNVRSPREVYPKATSAALTALRLDDTIAEAHTALGLIKFAYDWDWSDAEKEFKQALEINSGDPETHFQYGFYLACVKEFDRAIAEMKRAEELDPVSLVRITGTAQIMMVARHYGDAIVQVRRALELDPNLGFAHWLLGTTYLYDGKYEQAIPELQRSIPLSGDSPDEPATLALAYARSGKKPEARKILTNLEQQSKQRFIAPSAFAPIYYALGDSNRAFECLEKGFEERDGLMILLKTEPMFDPFRNDPRFAALLERVGFPK